LIGGAPSDAEIPFFSLVAAFSAWREAVALCAAASAFRPSSNLSKPHAHQCVVHGME
jgi:hypothetical protein